MCLSESQVVRTDFYLYFMLIKKVISYTNGHRTGIQLLLLVPAFCILCFFRLHSLKYTAVDTCKAFINERK